MDKLTKLRENWYSPGSWRRSVVPFLVKHVVRNCFYDHPGHHPLSVLRDVPWCITEASNTTGYEPVTEREAVTLSDEEVHERLRNLGYV